MSSQPVVYLVPDPKTLPSVPEPSITADHERMTYLVAAPGVKVDIYPAAVTQDSVLRLAARCVLAPDPIVHDEAFFDIEDYGGNTPDGKKRMLETALTWAKKMVLDLRTDVPLDIVGFQNMYERAKRKARQVALILWEEGKYANEEYYYMEYGLQEYGVRVTLYADRMNEDFDENPVRSTLVAYHLLAASDERIAELFKEQLHNGQVNLLKLRYLHAVKHICNIQNAIRESERAITSHEAAIQRSLAELRSMGITDEEIKNWT